MMRDSGSVKLYCAFGSGFASLLSSSSLLAYRHGEELPEELQRRETRIARIREAKKALEERAREKAKSEDEDSKEAKPEPKAQYNFTDPESRIMKGSDGFVQGYHTQVAVEPLFQLVG